MDIEYFRKKLKVILRDLSSYRADELARELFRLAKTSDEKAIIDETNYIKQLSQQPSNHNGDVNNMINASVDVLVEALRKLSSGEYGTAKLDQCKHGLYGYEECGECVSDIALEALAAYEAKPINESV